MHPPDLPTTLSKITSSGVAQLQAVHDGSTTDQSLVNSKIMIVDDEKFNILVVKRHLSSAGYHNFLTCSDSTQAYGLIESERPDVILLDIMMPEVSGIDILRKRQSRNETFSPVIVLTASSDDETKRTALQLGATDFLAKPVNPSDLLPRVRNALLIKNHHHHLETYAHELERQVQIRTRELLETRAQIIHCLGRAAEYRDNETGQHVIRVGRFSGIIAEELGFTENFVELIQFAAQLHDIGKIGIPDSILLNPGRLSAEQFRIMQTHCLIGREIIMPSVRNDPSVDLSAKPSGANLQELSLMELAASIAMTHHEKWDGNGYPNGLGGDGIPIEGRITAVADVFDALSSARPYKKAFSYEKCFEILARDSGTHFDPDVVDAFFRRSEEIIAIKEDLNDAADPLISPDLDHFNKS